MLWGLCQVQCMILRVHHTRLKHLLCANENVTVHGLVAVTGEAGLLVSAAAMHHEGCAAHDHRTHWRCVTSPHICRLNENF